MSSKLNLGITSLKPAKNLQCGGYEWLTSFDFNRPVEKKTLIIQKYHRQIDYQACKKDKKVHHSEEYFEAWQVNQGRNKSKDRISGYYDYDDNFFQAPLGGTRGKITIRAQIKFFQGQKIPPEMRKYHPQTSAGDLYSSPKEPKFWQSKKAYLPHDLTIEWNCCGEEAVTKVFKTIPAR